LAAGDRIALLCLVGSEETRCLANCEGEVFRPLGEAEVADSAAVDEVEMVAKAPARRASACAEGSVQCTTVKRVCLDTDNGADDVGTMLDEGGVLGNRVDEFHRAAVDATEVNQRRNVDLHQDLDEKFCWEVVKLASGIMRGDALVSVSPIVKWALCF